MNDKELIEIIESLIKMCKMLKSQKEHQGLCYMSHYMLLFDNGEEKRYNEFYPKMLEAFIELYGYDPSRKLYATGYWWPYKCQKFHFTIGNFTIGYCGIKKWYEPRIKFLQDWKKKLNEQ